MLKVVDYIMKEKLFYLFGGRNIYKKFFHLFYLSWIFFSSSIYAWNSVGHRLAAQIAYYNMNANSKKIISEYNKLLNTRGRKYNLIDSAVWMDTLYSEKYKDFRNLHYIDMPLGDKDIKTLKPHTYNAVFAVKVCEAILRSKDTDKLDKALAFRILWHVVADLHQPLHAISHYSKNFPNGDRGGNLEILPKNKVANNLHAFWDRGGGVFSARKVYSRNQIKYFAKNILKNNPCALSKSSTTIRPLRKLASADSANLDPQVWANESYKIAKDFAYAKKIDKKYQKQVQKISQERIALAGCRLAAVIDINVARLNSIS